MSTSFRIDKDAGVVYRTISGEVSIEELVASYTEVFAHPDYHPGMKALTDMSGVTPSAFRRDVLRLAEFARSRASDIGPLQIAVVVSSDTSYGMVRELEATLAQLPINIALFRDLAAAEKWLGLVD